MASISPSTRTISGKIVSSTNNISGSYGTGAGSKILTGLGYPNKLYKLYVYNGTATDIWIRTASKDDGTPASDLSDTQEILIKAGNTVLFDSILVLDNIFVRSAGSTISSGTVSIAAFGS